MSCPEIVIDGEDMKAYEKVMMNVSICSVLCYHSVKLYVN